MGKRPCISDRAGRAVKAAKTKEPLVEILAFDPDLTAPCREMLQSALPYAMASLPGQRHPYETQLIDSVMGICNANDARHRADVQADEEKMSSVEARKQEAMAELDTAKQRAVEKTEIKNTKAKLMAEAQQLVDQATLTLTEENEKQQASIVEKQRGVEQKIKCEETMSEAWEPLRESKFVGQRKEKSKAMMRLSSLLEATDAPDSLKSALPLALKLKVDARGGFAEKAVEHAEKSLKEHVAGLGANIASLEATGAEVLAAITDAEGALKKAEHELQEAQDVSLAAENEWCAEETAAVHAQEACDKLAEEARESEQALVESTAALELVLELNTKFTNLLERRAPVEEDDVKMSPENTQEDIPCPNDETSALHVANLETSTTRVEAC